MLPSGSRELDGSATPKLVEARAVVPSLERAPTTQAVRVADLALGWVEQGYVPDAVIRRGIRRLNGRRRADLSLGDCETAAERVERFVREMDDGDIAPVPHLANEQHYEVPAELFALVLGPRRKYSSCWWPAGVETLAAAEDAALAETCARADVAGGQEILELGCGWGSLTLWMAEHHPTSRITGVSNSASQRAWIEREARARGLDNVRVITADMNSFAIADRFDRVVSVEMFEHMRNWRALFARVHGWLRPGGKFFLHVFCHRAVPYAFLDEGPADWMSRHFFSGGIMPSDDLPSRFQDRLRLVSRWRWDGRHYARTAEAWLENLDRCREQVLPLLALAYGADQATLWLQRWRIFFMACAELFGHAGGQEWWVSHSLFERPRDAASDRDRELA
ncbi:MAG: class I SAM-dependent methyltransferase [Deltaproteobacteria bacterium]|nr:class I SAM-dependent methyltransferase [Deltaproteobacteria bacterium]